jgi:hypothetical protein
MRKRGAGETGNRKAKRAGRSGFKDRRETFGNRIRIALTKTGVSPDPLQCRPQRSQASFGSLGERA